MNGKNIGRLFLLFLCISNHFLTTFFLKMFKYPAENMLKILFSMFSAGNFLLIFFIKMLNYFKILLLILLMLINQKSMDLFPFLLLWHLFTHLFFLPFENYLNYYDFILMINSDFL